MAELQCTIARHISFSGRGLHTGKVVQVALKPAAENFGIQFCRIDTEQRVLIPADCDWVVDVSRGTTIEFQGQKVATIEHLMSAVIAMGIDNLLIELDGQEIPILDGSAQPFVDLILSAGIVEQSLPREYFVLDQTFYFYDEEKDVEMTAIPHEDYSITVMIDFNSEVIGKQYAQLKSLSEFKNNFAAARTFCFLHEVEVLYAQGLIKGGELNNAIVVAEKEIPSSKVSYLAQIFNQNVHSIPEKGIVNHIDLRYTNEMARHKLVDVIGDLGLIGTRIKGKIIASKPGHSANVAFAQQLKKYIREQKRIREIPIVQPNASPIMDLTAIKEILPHRSPFLLLDKVIEISESHIVAVKNVTNNEPFFEGHFPNKPIMPGVLQIEAMAQTGGILALKREGNTKDFLTYLVEVEDCKFKFPVEPGDTLVIKMEILEELKRGFRKMKGIIYVGQRIVAEAKLTAKIFKP
ncbi:MAG: bifunctional UDP-3-O-[3-hydroxymyristoyl] N-acetylglucosamine deacetylase/3-hydroxyacyl-ACP dehydratase [Chitinophagales bacterium]|nr:bifunctional UDP-3-O-[3-hydroxymyristoyl] N-acetylglucosamine deacetylase/3-hydroxyacyl-ACP dehydratase [Chitinophagales bacterium]MCZ2392799.1 bifunctional UDP-3-O-[3-hydroxymyristoyl] N-acetylglucosamine deacetylase/3-hydroxyacyl-ACP dehydratase [Chitinophagales bacterium]